VPFKIDGVVIIDSADAAQREVKVQKGWQRTGTKGAGIFKKSLVPNMDRDLAGASVLGSILASDFHLENLIGLFPILHFGVGHESNEPPLEGTEAAFDFAFGLRCGSDEMGDSQSSQSTLELAFWIRMIVARTWSEKTEAIGINGLRDAVSLKGCTEVREVCPGGVRAYEASSDVEAGMVVDGEQQDLFG
jgi:hypothetical protein